MVEEAVRKIEEEMKSVNNDYVRVIGEFLIKQLEINPEAAESILNQDKSIMNSLNAMRKLAEKKKIGNMAVLTPEEGFKVVSDYFGIGSTVSLKQDYNLKCDEVKKQPIEHKEENNIEFDIDLEDYI